MSFSIDVVCTDRDASLKERQERTVKAVGEILPFVMAKYVLNEEEAGRAESRFDRRTRIKF